MASSNRTDVRAVIKFCTELGHTPTQIYQNMKKTAVGSNVSRTIVFDWSKRFRDGRETLEDEARVGRKRTHGTTLITSVRDALSEDRRLTVRSLADSFGVGYGTIHRIITDDLQMSKVHARWVPRLLKSHEKERRVRESRAFLARHKKEGDAFLSRIITTDETWLWFYDPETKSQSAVWKHSDSPPPKKARVSKCGGKYMFIMFADMEGMILNHAVPSNTTVNADYYSKVIRRDLVHALQKKRPGIPLDAFILHMDNASSHTAERTRLEIAVQGFEILSHPPYSPDLAPFDFAVFPSIKSQLKGRRFETLQELRTATNNIIASYDTQWYKAVFQQWVKRHQRCIQCAGEYFEKQ